MFTNVPWNISCFQPATPWKINMLHPKSHGALLQMIFLFNWLISRFQPLPTLPGYNRVGSKKGDETFTTSNSPPLQLQTAHPSSEHAKLPLERREKISNPGSPRQKSENSICWKDRQKRFSSWWFQPNPFEKYDRQIGSFPQGLGWKQPKMFETTSGPLS